MLEINATDIIFSSDVDYLKSFCKLQGFKYVKRQNLLTS